MNATRKSVVGVDIAKSVFQVYTVAQETGEVINQQIKRAQLLQWFANRAPCLIARAAVRWPEEYETGQCFESRV